MHCLLPSLLRSAHLLPQELLNQNLLEIGPKYQVVYAAFAFVCGGLGVHNYYIGRWKRGLAQTLICILTLGLGSIVTNIWATINIFKIKTDGKNRLLFPSNPAKWTFGILAIPFCLFWLAYIGTATYAGYTLAMNRYRAAEMLSNARMIEAAGAYQVPTNLSTEYTGYGYNYDDGGLR